MILVVFLFAWTLVSAGGLFKKKNNDDKYKKMESPEKKKQKHLALVGPENLELELDPKKNKTSNVNSNLEERNQKREKTFGGFQEQAERDKTNTCNSLHKYPQKSLGCMWRCCAGIQV